MSPSPTTQRGFTLTELLVVVALVSILSGLALVSLSNRWAQERLLAAARETHSWLEYQRRLAMKEGKACEIKIDTSKATLDPTGSSLTLLDGKTVSNSCSSQAPLFFRSIVPNGSSITLSTAPANATAVRFSFRGLSEITTSTGTSNELVLQLNQADSNKQRCIKIMSPLGLIRNGWAPVNTSPCNYSNSF